MSRRRTNDPLGISETPNIVTDPIRVAELLKECTAKLLHIHRQFRAAKRWLGDDATFNLSLERLRRATVRRTKSHRSQSRLHPEIELIISHFARKEAAKRTGATQAVVIQEDTNIAARRAAKRLNPRSGRPAARNLRWHVEAAMALMQEMTGRPVMASRSKNSLYAANLGKTAQGLLVFARGLEPSVTEIQLVNIIKTARRKYAGKSFLFADFCPSYGVTFESMMGGGPLANGARLETFEANIPIYCP